LEAREAERSFERRVGSILDEGRSSSLLKNPLATEGA
jgi:hypothetical protein